MHAALAQKFYISSVFNLLMTTSNAFFISVIVFKNIFSIYFLFFLKICISLLILFICSHMLSTLSIRALNTVLNYWSDNFTILLMSGSDAFYIIFCLFMLYFYPYVCLVIFFLLMPGHDEMGKRK